VDLPLISNFDSQIPPTYAKYNKAQLIIEERARDGEAQLIREERAGDGVREIGE
jgi:hypothetical protein